MIESGSHSPGFDPAEFDLPPNTAMRWELPHPSLARLIGDYFVFDSEGEEVMGARTPILPTWPMIRFVLAERPITIEAPGVVWSPLPEAGFYGSASGVMHHTSYGGVTIGVNLTPAGVARLLDIDLSKYRDRMVPLDEVANDTCQPLIAELRASDQGPAVKEILDRFFLERMDTPSVDEDRIIHLNQLLLDETVRTAKDLGRRMSLASRTLQRFSLKRFGYPPQALIARTRFLRSLMAVKAAGERNSYHAIDEAYTDASHFLRDCERFLGMTARRFSKLETPFLDAILRVRTRTLEVATPGLGPAVYKTVGRT